MSQVNFNWLSAILASSGLLIIGYVVVQLFPEDHPIEEIVEDALEDAIESVTGADVKIDLTPESNCPENPDSCPENPDD